MEAGIAPVRVGVIGLGNMGSFHAKLLEDGRVSRAVLAAVCDPDETRLAAFPDRVARFTQSQALNRSGLVDAVLVVTPHPFHLPVAADALTCGRHVVIEKPLGIRASGCDAFLRDFQDSPLRIGMMLNQRTDPHYIRLREIVRKGELGEITRISWTITDWFRTEAYYQSSEWRATWAGEGGGVIINQSVHNLDLFQWIFGLPKSVRAECRFGRYHQIETEDEVVAVFEMPNGASAVFTTSTGEAPGLNRLEVAGENGLLILDSDRLVFHRNAVGARTFSQESTSHYEKPATSCEEFADLPDHGPQHAGILQNFVDAILDGTPLIAPVQDGLASVEMINAVLLSAFTDRRVSIPAPRDAFDHAIQARIETSRLRQPAITPIRKVEHHFGTTAIEASE